MKPSDATGAAVSQMNNKNDKKTWPSISWKWSMLIVSSVLENTFGIKDIQFELHCKS